jgi:hypothetical protein
MRLQPPQAAWCCRIFALQNACCGSGYGAGSQGGFRPCCRLAETLLQRRWLAPHAPIGEGACSGGNTLYSHLPWLQKNIYRCCCAAFSLFTLSCWIQLAPFARQLGVGAEAVVVVRLVAARSPAQVAGQCGNSKIGAQWAALQG